MRTHVAVLAVVVLLTGTVGVSAAVPTDPAEASAASNAERFDSSTPELTLSAGGPVASAQTDDEIRMTTTLDRAANRSGEISATVSFRFPSRVSELTARIPDGSTVTGTDGFDRENATTYEWDERTEQPSVTFRVDADRLTDGEGPLGEDGRYLFTDTDEWALVQIPSTGARWLQTGNSQLAFSRETAVDGPGVAGERMAFLGAHEIETHTAHGQTFRLVIPEAAELEEPVEDIFDSLSHASDTLRVGDRDEEVLVIAAPSDDVAWGVRGLQIGDSDMWVQDSEELDLATNVWVHEYVHTRQEYRTTTETEWFSEATATYYAGLLTLEGGAIEFDRFQRVLDRGEVDPQSASVLSRPDSWENNANYWKGSLVVGDTDRRIRAATDSESSFETVFRSVNSHDDASSGQREEPVTASDLEGYVSAAGGEDVATESTRYLTTAATPAMWDAETHGEVFGQRPARFSFTLAAEDPIRITTANGSTPLAGTSGTLAVGETLSVEMVARNVGGTVGSYELPFRVNESQSTATGRLAPNETATHQFEHQFTEPGQYVVTVGDEQLDIRVEEPAAGDEASIDVEAPGFGPLTAVSALLLVGVLALRRQ